MPESNLHHPYKHKGSAYLCACALINVPWLRYVYCLHFNSLVFRSTKNTKKLLLCFVSKLFVLNTFTLPLDDLEY